MDQWNNGTMKANITVSTIPKSMDTMYSNRHNTNTLVVIIASTAGGVAFFIFVSMVTLFMKSKQRKRKHRTKEKHQMLRSINDSHEISHSCKQTFESRSFRSTLDDLLNRGPIDRQSYTPKDKSKTCKNRTKCSENCYDDYITDVRIYYSPKPSKPTERENIYVDVDMEDDNKSHEVIINNYENIYDNKSDNGYYETLDHVKARGISIYDVPDKIEKQDQTTDFEGYEVTYIEGMYLKPVDLDV